MEDSASKLKARKGAKRTKLQEIGNSGAIAPDWAL
ncbi:uncharacterized protein G2W53_037169 [Senna tora]|uniref:Uncharacterized protein n=1 Tax=Senna tora TaxID=362788 RepID=A0A834W9E2_9FABA|nr:uncharacterized protein G2W53_037169 [Senna tora]